MPLLSPRERAFLSKYTIKARVEETTPFPWAPGSYMTEFKPDPANAAWLSKMDAQSLMRDAGPSGTTDEILQTGDYVSITSDTYGACIMRDAASAGMHLQMHHSWAEVAQGATATDRATPKFNWDDPYMALKECPINSRNNLRAIPDVWPRPYGASVRVHTERPPDSIDHFDEALKHFVELTASPESTLAKAIQECDFGSGPERSHPFDPSGEAENADRLIQHYICTARGETTAAVNLLTRVVCAVRGHAKPAVAPSVPVNTPAAAAAAPAPAAAAAAAAPKRG